MVVLVELLEGHTVTDIRFLLESSLYGLFIPVVTWLLLTRLANSLAYQARIEAEHRRRRSLTHQLALCQDWDELVRFIVQFPHTVLPVEHVALFLCDLHNVQLTPVAHWKASTGKIVMGTCGPLHARLCHTCQLPRLRHVAECEYRSTNQESGSSGKDLCVPLAYNRLLVSMLRIGCRSREALTTEQSEFLDWAAPEIALALVRLVTFPGQIAQARTAAQASERRLIAQTLHNSLAQQIGYLHLSLDRLASDEHLPDGSTLRSELEHLRSIADEAYAQIRSTLALLRSQESVILPYLLSEQIAAVTRKTGLLIDYDSRGAPPQLSPDLSHCLLSVIQEGLNNVAKHAGDRRVRVEVDWAADVVSVVISDQGVGFDPALPVAEGHYGLTMMRERVAELGGQMQVESAPGQGTRVLFQLPLPQAEAVAGNGAAASPPQVAPHTVDNSSRGSS
jgi:signal transduction histidine kinase